TATARESDARLCRNCRAMRCTRATALVRPCSAHVTHDRTNGLERLDALGQSGRLAGRCVAVQMTLRYATLHGRLRHAQRSDGRFLVAACDGGFRFADEGAHAVLGRTVDRGATLGLANALLGGLVVRHGFVSQFWRKGRRVISPASRSVKAPGNPAKPSIKRS